MNKELKNILITGGAGYVGSALVPSLLEKGYKVTVFDTYWYGKDIFKNINNPNLIEINGDIRDRNSIINAAKNQDSIIHLACISNDPSFDLDPDLGKSINYDAFFNIVEAAEKNKIKRLIMASSTSQYGIKPLDLDVTEDVKAEPITDYARFKIECENILLKEDPNFEYVFARPATLAGYAPRLRLDLSVNILTIHALVNKVIKVFGGDQMRPVLNIKDMVRFYNIILESPKDKINKEAFNIANQNITIRDLAYLIKDTLNDPKIKFEVTPNDDNRSYHVNTDKVRRVLNFEYKHDLRDAILSIRDAYQKGIINDGLNNPIYHNIKRMKQLKISD